MTRDEQGFERGIFRRRGPQAACAGGRSTLRMPDMNPLPFFPALGATAALLFAAASPAADWASSVKFPEAEKAVSLFNGKDLSGWKGNEKHWSVQDGAIVGKNTAENVPKASTYLVSDKKYHAFRLVFEGKLVTSEMHTGVAIWGTPVEKEGDPHSYMGHLVMFPSAWGFYDLYRRNSIYQDNGAARKAGRQHDWNQMEILAQPPRIRLVVNGQSVADWTDPKPELCTEGPLGLQLHANKEPQEVHFRGLVIAENPGDKLITVTATAPEK